MKDFKKLEKINWGFTLIELMVTVSIMTIISSVIIYENSKFNSSILLTNLAYEGALFARQSQVFGLSSRATAGFTDIGYGLHFDLSKPREFVFFADTDVGLDFLGRSNKSSYQPGEEINIIGITNRNRILNICTRSGASWTCAMDEGVTTDLNLSVASFAFIRPDPEPEFRNAVKSQLNTAASLYVIFSNDTSTEDRRCLVVTNSGQISVKSQSNCRP